MGVMNGKKLIIESVHRGKKVFETVREQTQLLLDGPNFQNISMISTLTRCFSSLTIICLILLIISNWFFFIFSISSCKSLLKVGVLFCSIMICRDVLSFNAMILILQNSLCSNTLLYGGQVGTQALTPKEEPNMKFLRIIVGFYTW